MTCKNCGKEILEIETLCPICGTELNKSIEESSVTTETESEPIYQQDSYNTDNSAPVKKKSKKPLVIGGIIAVLIILCGVAAMASTDLFKSPKQIYMQSEQKNLNESIALIKDHIKKSYNEQVKPFSENPYQDKMEVSMNLDLKGIPGVDPNMAPVIQNLIAGSKLVFDSKVNPAKKQSLTDFALTVAGNEFLKGSFVNDNNKLGLSVPAFYDKYVTADGNDLKSLYKNLSIPENGNIPKKIINNNDILKSINLNEKDIDKIIENYGQFYYDSLKDSQFTMEKNSSVDLGGSNVNCKKITINMDEKSYKEFVTKLADKVENDDALFNLVYDNIINVMKLYEDAGYINLKDADFADISDKAKAKDSLKKAVKEFKDEFAKTSLPQGYKITVWIDGQKNIVARKYETSIKDSNGEAVNLNGDIKNFTKDGKSTKSIELVLTGKPNEKLTFKYNADTSTASKESNGKLSLSGTSLAQNGGNIDMNITFNSKPDEKSNNQKAAVKFDMKTEGFDKSSDNVKLSGEFNIDGQMDDKNKSRTYNYDVKLNMQEPGSSNAPISMGFKIKQDIKFGVEPKMPAINASNSLNLNTASQEELQGAMTQVNQAVQKFFMQNSSLFQSLMGL